MRLFCFFISCFLFVQSSWAATLVGDVSEMQTRLAMADVAIQNIRTGELLMTSSDGKFTISGDGDDLIEFRKLGYKTVRVRIPKGLIPPYYKIIMQETPIPILDENNNAPKDWVSDSIKYYNLYKQAIEYEKLTGLDIIRHPFSALSKRSRRIWAFQKEYTYFQKEKYIDYTFNETLVKSITNLEGDSLQYFMRRFRPTYEQLHSMSDYSFYLYIKRSAVLFRTGMRPEYRPSIPRNSD